MRQADVAVPGQRLRHFGRDAGTLQAGNEKMPTAMKIRKEPVVILIRQKIRRLAFGLLTFRFGLRNPHFSRRRQVAFHHLVRLAFGATWHSA